MHYNYKYVLSFPHVFSGNLGCRLQIRFPIEAFGNDSIMWILDNLTW